MVHPRIRNPSKINGKRDPLYKIRNYIFENFPPGPEGFVFEDIDGVLRIYGYNFEIDEKGRYMFLEFKEGEHTKPQTAQNWTFRTIHKDLEKANPKYEHYQGFYVMNYTHEDWYDKDCRWWLSEVFSEKPKIEVSREEFHQFFLSCSRLWWKEFRKRKRRKIGRPYHQKLI